MTPVVLGVGWAVTVIVALLTVAWLQADGRKERAELLDRIQVPEGAAMRIASESQAVAAPTDAQIDEEWFRTQEAEVPWDADLSIQGREA